MTRSHKVVLAAGCYDPLHLGHFMHLEAAAKMGDYLVVAVTSDASVRKEKGRNRPVFTQDERAYMLRSLRVVSQADIVDSTTEALQKWRPAIFVKGSDYIGRISPEHEEFCAENRIQIRFTTTPKLSATALLNEFRFR